MIIEIEITDGELREMIAQSNEAGGAKRGQVHFITVAMATRALRSVTMKKWLVERALELATDSCADVLQAEKANGR